MTETPEKPILHLSPWVKLLLDLGPLAVFFAAYRTLGLEAATLALIVATLISLIMLYAATRKIAVMPLITALCVGIFGGLTLLLQDELFIKMKPTVVNLLFAGILFGGLAFGRPMLKYLLESAVSLTEKGWRVLSRRWGFYFVFLAGLNEFIWRHYSTDFWVDFKVFGMFSLTLLFTLAQIPLMQREMIEETPPSA